MSEQNVFFIIPPSPELEAKIIRTKEHIRSRKSLPAQSTPELLEQKSFEQIMSVSKKTSSSAFVLKTSELYPVTGEKKILVLLVDFPDKPAQKNQDYFNKLLFSIKKETKGSMRDYFREVSYNQLDLIGTVSGSGGPVQGWYRAQNPKTYYTNKKYGKGDYPQNAQKLVEEVIAMASANINFAEFDNDGDKIVDALIVITAGVGAEYSGQTIDFWAHMGDISPVTLNGVTIKHYFIGPEEGRIGVMSHELGHLLMKYPELYDTDYGSRGTGNWDLMGGGSWNNGGETPAHPTAWCKVKSGWIKPVTIFNDEQIVTIPPYAKNPVGYKLPVGNVDSKEYFLLSNRKQTGFDKKIPGEGLIIEHCDDNQPDNNDETHYLVNLEQCDGKMDLNENVNRGDSTDPFPCPGNDKFTADSNPNSRAYDGSDTRISVTSIKRVGDNIQAVINVGGKYIQKWHDNVTVSRTFATVQSQNAWVYIEPLGWRKISTTSPDGVSNMLILFCEAMAGNIKVNVYIDAEFVYRVQSA